MTPGLKRGLILAAVLVSAYFFLASVQRMVSDASGASSPRGAIGTGLPTPPPAVPAITGTRWADLASHERRTAPVASTTVPAGVALDPFRAPPTRPAFHVRAILFRGDAPYALLDERVVVAGDKVADYTVSKIDRKGVTLERDGSSVRFELEEPR